MKFYVALLLAALSFHAKAAVFFTLTNALTDYPAATLYYSVTNIDGSNNDVAFVPAIAKGTSGTFWVGDGEPANGNRWYFLSNTPAWLSRQGITGFVGFDLNQTILIQDQLVGIVPFRVRVLLPDGTAVYRVRRFTRKELVP